MMFSEIAEYTATIIEYLIYADFMVRFLSPKRSEHKLFYYVVIAVFNTLLTVIFNSYMTYEGFLGVIRIGFNFIFAMILLKGTLYEKIFVSVITDISVLLINFTIQNTISNIFDLKITDIIANRGMLRLILLFISKFLFFIATRLLIKFKNTEKYSFSFTEWLMLSITFVSTMSVGIIIFRIILTNNISSESPAMIGVGLSLIMINIFLYILMGRISKKNEEKALLIIDKMQLKMYEQQLSDTEKQYTEIQKIRHDMKNHMQCITAFLEDNEVSHAQKYINDIVQNKLNFGVGYIKTGNRVVDIISNTKLAECRNRNIKTAVNISEFELDIDDIDICIVLGNLFDNAIEACSDIPDSMIYFEISQRKGYVNIIIKNTITGSVLEGNPELKTNKKNKHMHGLGIKSAKEVIEKYNGMIDFYEENNNFVADVWILCKIN